MKADREIKVRCSACGHLTRIPTITNADRIRAMTNEELATWIYINRWNDIESLLEWLKEESENK